MTLRMTSFVRMQTTMATASGLPAVIRRSHMTAITGQRRGSTSVGMYSWVRTWERPP